MANHHPRVEILRPGPGVGGHCIAVDPWFIVEAAPDLAGLTRTARDGQRRYARHTAEQIVATSRAVPRPPIACLGLSFKADVGDLRESPAVDITARVAAALPDVKILTVEPHRRRCPPARRARQRQPGDRGAGSNCRRHGRPAC